MTVYQLWCANQSEPPVWRRRNFERRGRTVRQRRLSNFLCKGMHGTSSTHEYGVALSMRIYISPAVKARFVALIDGVLILGEVASRLQFKTVFLLAILFIPPPDAVAWNIPTHMITGAMAHRLLQSQNPQAAASVQALLEKHPWYADRWRDEIARLPEAQRSEALFMWAARWADDIRTQARLQREVVWHYINYPFKPEREPEHIKPLPPQRENILTAIAENERVVRSDAPTEKRAVALAWLFHLIGDIHQPLHTAQFFSREYPNGDRGGNEAASVLHQGAQLSTCMRYGMV
jgi:hypothetical protein